MDLALPERVLLSTAPGVFGKMAATENWSLPFKVKICLKFFVCKQPNEKKQL